MEEQLSGDCIINLRTVASFGHDDHILKRYESYMQDSHKQKLGQSHKFGLAFGYSQFIQYAVFGALYYAGANFMEKYNEKPGDIFTAMFSMMFSSFQAG